MQTINMNYAKGIDVSHYQTNTDWLKVKDAGYSFAFIKSTEGKTLIDSEFSNNYINAKANGIFVGPYHFARPYNDPVIEADFFIDTIRSFNGFQKGDLPPVLDLEVTGNLDKQRIVNWAIAWIKRVKERTGLQAIIYTYLYFARTYLDESLSDVPLWFARYGVTTPEDVAGWKEWTFLQYSSKGTVPGVSTSVVDVNLFYGDLEALGTFINVEQNMNSIDLNIPSYSTKPILKSGDTGSEVEALQKLLASLGYIPGNIDGIFGPNTEQAVKLFQSTNNLTIDGIVGPNTWGVLMDTPIKYTTQTTNSTFLKLGDSGDDVKELQSNLSKLIFSPGAIDGIFGQNTESAVRAFQSANGIKVDGIVGPQTLNAIQAALNSLNQSTKPTLKLGSTGAVVQELQNDLIKLGYTLGAVDGKFGAKTENAVRAFQQSVGLSVDGIVGVKTWSAILSRI